MSDVSRETPPVPVEARGVFGHRVGLAQRYAQLVATEGTLRGLIGPREVPRLWERHILNCAAIEGALPWQATVADVGSGAGLPGIVLAIARPDLSVTLIESLQRRTRFLDECVESLELTNVTVSRGRAEEFVPQGSFDVVTSRAVADLGKLARWSMPLVKPGGTFLPIKGEEVAGELEGASDEIRGLGGVDIDIRRFSTGPSYPQVTAVVVRKCAKSG